MSFKRLIQTPENRSALMALESLARCLLSEKPAPNPLYIHGPAGSGKTCLVSAFVEEATRQLPRLVLTCLQAAQFSGIASRETEGIQERARNCDVLIVEDFQHFGGPGNDVAAAVEPFVQLFDQLLAQQRRMVFTANRGPGQLLHLPCRLTSRLGCGLVVRIEGLKEDSRLAILRERAQRRQLAVSREVLAWLAQHLVGGGRQLEGALIQLEALARWHKRPLDVATVSTYFREQADAVRPTVERIAQRVGSYFRIEQKHLQSRRRYQKLLLPRQVGMYLARGLTNLSLREIGSYFGGRDHSTVLHACRKIELELGRNAILSGVVKQLATDLA